MANITEFDFTEIFNQEGRMAFLSTVNPENGAIQQNVVSWIRGYKPNVVRIAVSTKSQLVKNIESNPNVNFSFFYNKSVVSVQAKARIVTKQIPEAPFALTAIEIEADELHDIMFYGAEIEQEPAYFKTYNNKAAQKLDEQVYAGLVMDYEALV